MVSTRTQDGSISTKTYTPLTLDLNSLSIQSPLPSPMRGTRNNGTGSPTKVHTPKSPRKASGRAPRTPTSARKEKIVNIAANKRNASISTAPAATLTSRARTRAQTQTRSVAKVTFDKSASNVKMLEHSVDFLEGNTFFPSVTIGAKETVGLSKIGRADQEVKMWEGILAEHKENMPSLVPVVEEKLWQAIHKRVCLDEKVAENVMVGDVNPAESFIEARLAVLEWALSTSKFGPEAENIKCAIAGYKSGDIGFTDHFTVIYAAHVVDTVATYGEFVRDRTEMLDRYYKMHGDGWMWYEPPLNIHPESKPKLCPSVALERQDVWSSLGGWFVNQGFWKRVGWVSRMKQTMLLQPGINSEQYQRHPTDPTLVNCQSDGPRLSYRSMLDSGATFPSLHEEDFDDLNINTAFYAAQSVSEILTANGVVSSRVFELFVCVLDNEGKQLVDQNNAVYPLSHKYLGGLCPVVQCITPLRISPTGIPIASRLSGILPFVASYVSSTPTRNILYLGEDRNSVLGSHRMPGQRKWSIELGPIIPGIPFDRYGDPKIRFSHRAGRLVDEDDDVISNVSYLRVRGDTGRPDETVTVTSDPATRQFEMQFRNDRLAALQASRIADEEEERRLRLASGAGGGGGGVAF
ncbi:hypothetical protein VTL71DRAFT_9291 [Oculimacula yallundae]|uniref:Uncharacterized protein n=1 Tax=Oculimacula yallundae TaxID=86028 RepID=A0ABR4BSM3_9HELO